eukprot:c3360_g1_i2.p1 GENE.c3360_g1_i2~~c3360_g1_i2.p1  ORF type:complete len:143 (+),score=29.38 c3360_g1_i2:147-575(+)
MIKLVPPHQVVVLVSAREGTNINLLKRVIDVSLIKHLSLRIIDIRYSSNRGDIVAYLKKRSLIVPTDDTLLEGFITTTTGQLCADSLKHHLHLPVHGSCVVGGDPDPDTTIRVAIRKLDFRDMSIQFGVSHNTCDMDEDWLW